MSCRQRELYIYYRVGARDLSRALGIVAQAHEKLRAQCPTLSARVLRRADDAADSVTLMEIYRSDDGIDGALQRRIEEALTALAPLLTATRHTETFVPPSSDAP